MRRLEGILAAVLASFLLAAAAPAQALVCGDGILDLPAEQCDGPAEDFACPGQCTVECLCPLNHVQCYEVKRRVFTPVPRTVTDQFGTSTASVERPERLCRPANKLNEEPGAETEPDHLVGYRFRHPFTKVRNQELINQFAPQPGQMVVDVLRPAWLMTPTIITLGPQPPVIDHFQCYKIKRSRGTPRFVPQTVTVTDATGSFTVMVRKPQYLCAPADKNQEDPGADQHLEHLVCFKSRSDKITGVTNQFANNQFGQQSLDLIRRVELCIPTSKNAVPSTTTTASTLLVTTTTAQTVPPTTVTTTTAAPSTTTTSSSTTTTTLYGSPSRAFLDRVGGLLD
jgi:hypothetical protein